MSKRHQAGKISTAVKHEDPGLDLSSLIDVSFLLLIFFLVTSTLEPRDSDLGMTMPTTDRESDVVDVDPDEVFSVNIAADGAISSDLEILEPAGDSHVLPNLKGRLKSYMKMNRLFNREPVVHLNADDSVSGQRFTDVINCFAAVGITNVALDKGEWGEK